MAKRKKTVKVTLEPYQLQLLETLMRQLDRKAWSVVGEAIEIMHQRYASHILHLKGR